MKKLNILLKRIGAISLSSAVFFGSINVSAFTMQQQNNITTYMEDIKAPASDNEFYIEENMAIDESEPNQDTEIFFQENETDSYIDEYYFPEAMDEEIFEVESIQENPIMTYATSAISTASTTEGLEAMFVEATNVTYAGNSGGKTETWNQEPWNGSCTYVAYNNTTVDTSKYVIYENAVQAENTTYDLVVYPFKVTANAQIFTNTGSGKIPAFRTPSGYAGYRLYIAQHGNRNNTVSMDALLGLSDLDKGEFFILPSGAKIHQQGEKVSATSVTTPMAGTKYKGTSGSGTSEQIYETNAVYATLNIPSSGTTVYYGDGGENTFRASLSFKDIESHVYQVLFNANGGSGAPNRVFKYGTDSSVVMGDIGSTVPTRSGYTFKGWSATPLWSSNKRIAYTAEKGGSAAKDGTTATITSSSWSYATYCNNTGGNSSNRTLVLYAQWEPNTYDYRITFNANGGVGSIPDTIIKQGVDSSVVMGDIGSFVPTRSGYTFKGWSATSTYSSSNKRIAYTSGSTGATQTSSSWSYATYCTNTGGNSSNRTLTLYAQWEPTYSHTLAYNANGGSNAPSSSTVTNSSSTYNMTVSGTQPTRTGYTFAGWNTNSSGTGTNYSAGGNVSVGANATVTLYAKWTPITYSVTYNGNGNTGGSTAPQTKTYGASINLQRNGFTKTGYHFTGWNTTSGGTGTSYPAGAGYSTNANLTLYAQWTINSSTLKVNPNNGSWNGSTGGQSFTQNYNTTKSIPVPTRTGYTFTGWTRTNTYGSLSSTTSAATYTFGSTDGVTDTITAGWKANNYTVTYIDRIKDTTTQLGTSSTASKPYGSTVRGSDKGSSTAVGAYHTGYYYVSDTSATVTTSGATVYRYFRPQNYTVTYIDVVDSTSGKELGRSTAPKPYNSTVRGSDKGNSTADNAYHNGYYYVSDTSATVTTGGATVYRIFKQRMNIIAGNIIWEDWNNKNSSRPANVTLYIHGSDGKTYTYTITGDNSRNTSVNKWPYSKEVPKYDSAGKVITYTVTQDKAVSLEEGLAYKDPVVNGYDITNKISNEPDDYTTFDYIKIPVTIIWDDDNDKNDFRPDAVTITLLQNGTVIKTVFASNDYTFEELLKYDENGDKYVYTITASDEDRYTKAENNSAPYSKSVTYTFIRPTYSVIIPKVVILDGSTGIGEYVVSVSGQIDDRDFVNVIPDGSFTMENDYLSPITATVKQDRTAFTNKENIKAGATSSGTITTKSLAGRWSGSFNFNIYFEFGR